MYILANILFLTVAFTGAPNSTTNPDGNAGYGFAVIGLVLGTAGAAIGLPTLGIYSATSAFLYRRTIPAYFDFSDNSSAAISMFAALSAALSFRFLAGLLFAKYYT